MTYSIKRTEQRLDKSKIISNYLELSQKLISLKQKIIHSKNNSRKLNQLKTSYVLNLTNKKKTAKATQENKELQKENNLLNKMIKQ